MAGQRETYPEPGPVSFSPRAAVRWLRNRRPLRLSWRNWSAGFQFDPIGRCRRCDHTTPYHYPTCRHYRATAG